MRNPLNLILRHRDRLADRSGSTGVIASMDPFLRVIAKGQAVDMKRPYIRHPTVQLNRVITVDVLSRLERMFQILASRIPCTDLSVGAFEIGFDQHISGVGTETRPDVGQMEDIRI